MCLLLIKKSSFWCLGLIEFKFTLCVCVSHLCPVWTDAWTEGLWRTARAARPPAPEWRFHVRLPLERSRCDDKPRRCTASSGRVRSTIPRPPPWPCWENIPSPLPSTPEHQSRVEPSNDPSQSILSRCQKNNILDKRFLFCSLVSGSKASELHGAL